MEYEVTFIDNSDERLPNEVVAFYMSPFPPPFIVGEKIFMGEFKHEVIKKEYGFVVHQGLVKLIKVCVEIRPVK
jgi:hypothetical protein